MNFLLHCSSPENFYSVPFPRKSSLHSKSKIKLGKTINKLIVYLILVITIPTKIFCINYPVANIK